MFDPNTLTAVSSANSRVAYDLRYSAKTGKFTLSDSIYSDLNLNENGFNVFQDAQGNIVFQVVPNQEAQIYSGKEGSTQKSMVFSAAGLISKMVENGKTTTWTAKRHEHEGNIYLTWEVLNSDDNDVEENREAEVEEVQPENTI